MQPSPSIFDYRILFLSIFLSIAEGYTLANADSDCELLDMGSNFPLFLVPLKAPERGRNKAESRDRKDVGWPKGFRRVIVIRELECDF